MTSSALSLNYAPLGLSRNEAAQHIGIGATLFDEMVTDGRVPLLLLFVAEFGAWLVRDDDD